MIAKSWGLQARLAPQTRDQHSYIGTQTQKGPMLKSLRGCSLCLKILNNFMFEFAFCK